MIETEGHFHNAYLNVSIPTSNISEPSFLAKFKNNILTYIKQNLSNEDKNYE